MSATKKAPRFALGTTVRVNPLQPQFSFVGTVEDATWGKYSVRNAETGRLHTGLRADNLADPDAPIDQAEVARIEAERVAYIAASAARRAAAVKAGARGRR